MKYIKKYENIRPLKYKYHLILMGSSGDVLFLLSIIDDSFKGYYGAMTYSYNNDYKELKKMKNVNKHLYKRDYIDSVKLYKSKDINECLIIMENHFDTKKFNL